MNVDGSARGNPPVAAAGIVLKNAFGVLLAAKTVAWSNVLAKLAPFKHGLQLAVKLRFQYIMIESNSFMLWDEDSDTNMGPSYYIFEDNGRIFILLAEF